MRKWLLFFALLSSPALAHDAIQTVQMPLGWKYPFSCCSDYDCRSVNDGTVKEKVEGYLMPSGEVIAYGDARVKDSPDGMFHWCTVAGEATGRTLCLFVPPRGF